MTILPSRTRAFACRGLLVALLGTGIGPARTALAQTDGARPNLGDARQDGDRARRGGQFGRRRGGGPFGRMFEPDLLRRDMPLISDELRLDDPQGDVAEALLLDYEAAFTDASEAMRERLNELRPEQEQSPEVRKQRDILREELRELRRKASRLRESGEPVDADAMEKIQQRFQEMRGEFEALRPPRPEGAELQQLMDDMSAMWSDWQRQRGALKADFMLSLRSILNEEQMEQLWPGFERALRRRKSLGRGQLSGESVDLFLVLRDGGFDDEERWQLNEIMQDYAVSLDRALVERDEYLDNDRQSIFQAMRTGDMEQAMLLLADEQKLRTAVRDVNERYADTVAAVVLETFDADRAATVQDAYRNRAFPRIFRSTAMQRTFTAVVDFDDLDVEVLGEITSLQAAYESELGPLNDRLLRTTLTNEPRRSIERVQRRMTARESRERREVEEAEDPIRDAYEDRTAMELRYRRQLEGLLTPEQVALLPDPPRERGRGAGDFGRFGRRGGRSDEDRAEREARMIEQFDSDGDGKLSDAEREAAWEARRNRRDDDA